MIIYTIRCPSEGTPDGRLPDGPLPDGTRCRVTTKSPPPACASSTCTAASGAYRGARARPAGSSGTGPIGEPRHKPLARPIGGGRAHRGAQAQAAGKAHRGAQARATGRAHRGPGRGPLAVPIEGGRARRGGQGPSGRARPIAGPKHCTKQKQNKTKQNKTKPGRAHHAGQVRLHISPLQ